MAACCLIALDTYGAAVAGRFARFAREADREDLLQRCSFFWAGTTPRPGGGTDWFRAVVPWTSARPEDEPLRAIGAAAPGGTTPLVTAAQRAEIAVRVGESAAADGERAGLRWMLGPALTDRYGHTEIDAANVILLGALGDPLSGAGLLGLLDALARLRGGGDLDVLVRVHAVVGIGAAAAAHGAGETARAWAAQTLFDVQSYLGSGDQRARATPCFVVGEELSNGATLDLDSQVALGAGAVLGVVSEVGLPLAETHPCAFRCERIGQTLYWAQRHRRFDPGRPFAAFGAAFVQYPELTIRRWLAARCGAQLWQLFAERDPDVAATAAGSGSSDVAFTSPLLEAPATQTAGVLRGRDLPSQPAAPLWSREGAQALVHHILNARWAPIMSLYGRERFLRLPLDDWDQALAELEQFVAGSVLARRQQELREAGALAVEALADGLAAVCRRGGEDAWRSSVDFAPRAACRQLLQAVRAACQAALVEGEREWRNSSHADEQEIAYLEKRVGTTRASMLETLRMVPSPIAVGVRAIVAVTAGILLMLGVPFSLGPVESSLLRALVGAAVGAVIIGLLVQRAVRARRYLLAAFDRWKEASYRLHDERDALLGHEAAHSVLVTIKTYCEWLLGLPGAPDAFRVRAPRRWEAGRPQASSAADACERQRRFLAHFAADLQTAARQWGDIQERCRNACVDSGVVRTLPALGREGGETLSRLGNLPGAQATLDSESARQLLSQLEQWTKLPRGRGHARTEPWIPFAARVGAQGWAQDAQLPEDLEREDARGRATGLAFFEWLDRFVGDRLALTLRIAVAHHYGVSVDALPGFPQSTGDLYVHLNARSEVPVLHDGSGVESTLVFASGPDDKLAHCLEGTQEVELSRNLIAVLRTRLDLSASDIVFAGLPQDPPSRIGTAYVARRAALQGTSTTTEPAAPAPDEGPDGPG